MLMDFKSRGSRDRRMGPEDIPWDRILLIAPVVILLLMALYLVISSVYQVDEYQKAVVMRFGKYHKTVEPGLQFCIPLVDTVLKVSTEEHSLRLPFGAGPTRPRNVSEEETLMLTADLNAAVVEWTVQWKVVEPQDYLFRFYKEGDPTYPERVITTVAQTVMNRLVGDYSMGEVLTEKRGMIASEARDATQKILDGYSCGVQIRDLQMQRVSPPEKVRPAFKKSPYFRGLRAVREGRVLVRSCDYICHPNATIGETVAMLARDLYPRLFSREEGKSR